MDIANQNNELRQYVFETADTRSFPTINSFLMRAHPIYKDETILSDRNVYILCLDAGYTIYEKIEDTKKQSVAVVIMTTTATTTTMMMTA